MKYFFDRNIAVGLVGALGHIYPGHNIVHINSDSRFTPTSEDVDIIRALSQETPRPVFLSSDIKMAARRPHERAALASSGLTVVFFRKVFHNTSMPDQAIKAIAFWPKLVELTHGCPQPTAFEITAKGKVNRVCLTQNLV